MCASYIGSLATTYSDCELGKLNIPVSVLSKLAILFETSVDYLVNQTDEKKPYPRKKDK